MRSIERQTMTYIERELVMTKKETATELRNALIDANIFEPNDAPSAKTVLSGIKVFRTGDLIAPVYRFDCDFEFKPKNNWNDQTWYAIHIAEITPRMLEYYNAGLVSLENLTPHVIDNDPDCFLARCAEPESLLQYLLTEANYIK